MSREIHDHKVNGANELLSIHVTDEPGSGGANHAYDIRWPASAPDALPEDCGPDHTLIRFQKGPIKEAGINGVTHEALLAVVADRLKSFQAGPYACDDNAEALQAVEKAQECLQRRTKARLARGVEGTHQK